MLPSAKPYARSFTCIASNSNKKPIGQVFGEGNSPSLSLLWTDSLSCIFQHYACLSPFSSISTLFTPPPALFYPLSTRHLISPSHVDNCSHLLMVHSATTFSFSQGLSHMVSRISILQPSSYDGSMKSAEFSSHSGPTLSEMAILPLLCQ